MRSTGNASEKATVDGIYKHLPVLERQVAAAKPAAVRLAFALFTVADGAFAEDLDVDLGGLIENDPSLFRSVLKARGDDGPALEGLLGNLGGEYVDRMAASCRALRARLRALQGVGSERLAAIRDKCIAVLKEEARQTCEIARQMPRHDT